MQTKNRNGVLGLETAKQVMVSFLILSVTAVAMLLTLTALDSSIGVTVDNEYYTKTVTNESFSPIVHLNITNYTLAVVNSSTSGYVITSVVADYAQSNGSSASIGGTPTGYNVTLDASNYTVNSSGYLYNATNYVFPNVSVSYTYVYTIDTRKMDNLVGNVSDGLETFFGSTGTIFSILIVVVIILAISIIIWAVGRFGSQAEQEQIDL